MSQSIKLGFDSRTIELPLNKIIPLKAVTAAAKASGKFRQIETSIREVGIIEPPVVSPDGRSGKYLLLDGHLRLEALKGMGEEKVVCLVSTDDEGFTYNKHISRLSPIQEHRMIREAVKRGVPEAKIAKALNINVSSIVRKRKLIDGICPEAVDMLKDKMVAESVFLILRRMKAVRQMEVATLMNDAGAYSLNYAKALLAATPKNQLLEPEKPKQIKGLNEEQMARMEGEMDNLQREYRLIEENYGGDVLHLTIAKGYLSGLLSNTKVVRYLRQNHQEILAQFEKIAAIDSLKSVATFT